MQVKQIMLCCLCLCLSNNLYADYDISNLQKLFTDKQQRTQIDAKRAGKQSSSKTRKTNKVSVLGYVKRSDGKSVAWVNTKNTMDKTRFGNVRVHQDSIGKNKEVGLTVDGRHAHIKPGETWYTESGKIVDSQK